MDLFYKYVYQYQKAGYTLEEAEKEVEKILKDLMKKDQKEKK